MLRSLAVIVSIFFTGCSAGNLLESKKEQCDIKASDDITIFYDNTEYIVLSEQVSKDKVGVWVGTVNERISGAMFSTVYLDAQKQELHVAVDDCFYRAVKAENLKENQEPMNLEESEVFETKEAIVREGLEVNSENATQLICEDKVYQVTDETIERERLDGYITSIAKYVVFDTNTKEVLSQKEYTQMDWEGNKSEGEQRTVWVYTDVYGIKEFEQNLIAVKINGVYHIAELL